VTSRPDLLRKGALAAALTLLAGGATAQQRGFYLTSPFSVGVTHETKFIVDDVPLDDDVLLVLPPTLSFLRLDPRGELVISYQPELQAFAKHHELTSLNHAATFLFARRLTPRFSVAVGDSFISTWDPSHRVIDSILLLPRDRLIENSAYLELSQRLGRTTTLTVRGDNTITRLGAPLESATELTERLTTSGSASLAQRLARRHLVTLTYTILDARPLRDQPARELPTGVILPAPAPERASQGSLGYSYEDELMAVRLAGGIVSGRDVTYTGAAQLERRLGRDALLSLSAQRNLSYFGGIAPQEGLRLANGVLPTSLYESITLRLHGDLSRKWSAEIDGSLQRSVSDLTGFDVQGNLARVRLFYRVSRLTSVYARAEIYHQSFNEFVGAGLDWQRYGVGFEIQPSKKPNPLALRARARRDADRRERRGELAEGDAPTAGGGLSAEPGTAAHTDLKEQGDPDADTGTRH
jgi:hypothetical protein